MTMMGGSLPRGSAEVGPTVATFAQYEAAQKAVSTLIAADIPARDIAIVGQGLRSVERVTGRLGYATAARSGAINGLLLGMLFAAIFVLGTPSVPVQAFVGVLFVGIAIGMLASLATFAIVRRRRDYASIVQVVAESYEVSVAAGSAAKARQVLGPQAATSVAASARPAAGRAGAGGAAPGEPASTSSPLEPPRYGQRIQPAPPEEPSEEAGESGSGDAGSAEPGSDEPRTEGSR